MLAIKKDLSMKINPEHPYDYDDTPTYKRQDITHRSVLPVEREMKASPYPTGREE